MVKWKECLLSEVCEINPGKKDLQGLDKDSSVSFLPMALVSEDGKIINQEERKLKEVIKGYTNFKDNDVLLAKITPCFENGKRAIAKNLINGIGFGSTEFHILRSKGEVKSDWVFYAISRADFCNIAKSQMTGTAGQKRVPTRVLEQFKIPVPSIKEQENICENIEIQFTRLDEVVKSLKTVKSKLRTYRKSVLKSAFEGKLTFSNKSGWDEDSFGNVTINYDSKRVPLNKIERSKRKGEYRYYGATEIVDYVNDYIFEGTYLLLGEDGANLFSKSRALSFIVEGRFWVNNHAHIVQAKDKVDIKFLNYYFNSLDLKMYVTGTAQPKLTQANMNKLRIPLPSIVEQRKIVEEFESRFSVIDKLDKVVDESLMKAETLRKSILKSAFAGKLVN